MPRLMSGSVQTSCRHHPIAKLEIRLAVAYALFMSNTARTLPDDDSAAFLKAVEEGLADADAGRTVPYEDVRRWLLSWGAETELPLPECK